MPDYNIRGESRNISAIRGSPEMKTILVVTCAAVLLAPMSSTRAAFKGCYERVYEARYLRQHKKQQIVKIRLQIGVGQGPDGPFEYLDRLDAVFRKTKRYQGNLVECLPKGDELSCGVESDGGRFAITDRGRDKGKQAIRITNQTYLRFDDAEDKLNVAATGEHREFRLYKVSNGPCP